MATRRRKRWKTVLPTVTLTAITYTVSTPTVHAYFPPVVPQPPSVIVVPPVVNPPVVVPPVVPPVVVPPVVPPPVVVPPTCHCPPPPNCVPEPATIISTLLGLAAAGGYGLARRQKSTQVDDPTEMNR
jgi:hypothetical protein